MMPYLSAIVLSIVHCVLGLENLNFYGEYVMFTPSTKSIEFELQKDMDVLLSEHSANESAPIDYLYRIHMVLSDSQGYSINFTIFKQGKSMLTGDYQLWDKKEKEEIAIDWGSQPNVIQVLTEVNNSTHSIFAWKDRSKKATQIRHLGIRVSDGKRAENQHSRWKIQEADAKDFGIRNAYRMCNIKFLPANLTSKPPPVPIYEIFITRELDENYAISVYKNTTEVARVKTTKMDAEDVYVSWDDVNGMIMLGLKNESAPILLWQDTNGKKNDFERIQFVAFLHAKGGRQIINEIKKETFVKIPQRYPKYFTTSPEIQQSTTESMNIFKGDMDWANSLLSAEDYN